MLFFQVKDNPAALLALCWYWASGGVGSKVCIMIKLIFSSSICTHFPNHFEMIPLLLKQDMVVLPYKDSLLLFSRYLQQLVMESLGKEFDLDGNRVCL